MDQAGDRHRKLTEGEKEQIYASLIKKIITLVEHQMTRNDIERQKENIYEYLDISRNGFRVSHLSDVMYLIQLLDRRRNVSEYETILEEILQICFIPPMLTKSSDVLTCGEDIQHYFTMLGYLLVCSKENHQMLVAVALINLLTKPLPDQRYYLSLDARIKFAAKSQLPEILSHLLELAHDNIYSKILKIVHLLTKDSGDVCRIFLYADALNFLITRLEPTWRERYPNIKPAGQPIDNVLYYEESSNIICTLLDYFSRNKKCMKDVKTVTIFSLWSLQYVYRLYVASTYRALFRNNILVIIIHMMELFPELGIVKSGLAEDIISVSLSPLYVKNTWAPRIRLTLSDDDYVFVQLLLNIVSRYVSFLGGVRLLEDYRIIHRLLKITINRHTVVWPQPQICTIAVVGLDVLKKIVPYIEDEFIENTGPIILLSVLGAYQVNDSDINVVRKCLETINHILKNSSSNLTVNSILFNNGTNIIIGICENIMKQKVIKIMKEKSLGLAFCVLNTLYKHSPPTDITATIDLAIRFMKQVVHSKPNEPVHDNRVIICLMDLTWEHIIKSEKHALQFVKKNGAFLMLDIIQPLAVDPLMVVFPKESVLVQERRHRKGMIVTLNERFSSAVQLVTLGALVDLCEYGQCIPYLITWSGSGEKITSMLMKLFREENERLKVKSGPRGQILDIKYPLMGKHQWIETFCKCYKSSLTGSPTCCDLFVSCRPKIYALLQMLNVRFAEEVEIADEHYKCYDNTSNKLEAKDQVTLLLAENFLALKLGEAWVELKTEIDSVPDSLTRMDEKIILNILDRSLKWSAYLQKKQDNILKNAYHKNLIEEQEFYNNLQEARLSEALQALNDLKYAARCSERMFRISQKFIRNSQIDKSVKLTSSDSCTQKTYFSKICVTPVFSQDVNVASKVGRISQSVTTLPVSPVDSMESCNIDVPEDLLHTPSDK